MLPQHRGLHVGFFNLAVLRINRNRRKAVLTGLPRGDFFFGEVAAVRTQANIKPCRRPLRYIESRREWNVNSFEHSTLLEDFRRQENCVPFLTFKFHDYEIFAGSSLQVLRVGDFLCFTATNFCDKDRLVFLSGNYFLRCLGSTQYPALMVFSFLLSTYQWGTQGRGPGGTAPPQPLILRPNWGPKGRKKPPHLISGSEWPSLSPPHLKVWILHCV